MRTDCTIPDVATDVATSPAAPGAWASGEPYGRDTPPFRGYDRERSGADPSPIDEMEIRQDVRDALTLLSKLRPRPQRIALLRGLGFRHCRDRRLTGTSKTKVPQLVAPANDEIYELLEQEAHVSRQSSPRADRLWELQHDLPQWLTEKIGRPSAPTRKIAGQSTRLAHARGDARRSRSTTTARPPVTTSSRQ